VQAIKIGIETVLHNFTILVKSTQAVLRLGQLALPKGHDNSNSIDLLENSDFALS
jgi:hypothetical protein